MQGVYPDTWILSALAKARTHDPQGYLKFLEVWRATGSVLALSRTHLMELRQHADEHVRADRYGVIADLLPAKFDMLLHGGEPPLDQVTDREIAVEILRLLGRPDLLKKASPQWVGFPTTIETAAELEEIRSQLEDPLFGDIFGVFRAALSMDAEERKRGEREAYVRPRLSSLPDVKPTDDQIREMLAMVEHEASNSPLAQKALSFLTPEQWRAGMGEATSFLRQMLERSQVVGFRAALAEGSAHEKVRKNEYFDIHLQNRGFTDRVRQLVASVTKATDDSEIDEFTRGVARASCPGLWLRDAVEIELRKAKPTPEPNDWSDLDHLAHLPYVDVFFADREVASVTRNVLRRRNQLPQALRSISDPVSTNASLSAIAEILRTASRRSTSTHSQDNASSEEAVE